MALILSWIQTSRTIFQKMHCALALSFTDRAYSQRYGVSDLLIHHRSYYWPRFTIQLLALFSTSLVQWQSIHLCFTLVSFLFATALQLLSSSNLRSRRGRLQFDFSSPRRVDRGFHCWDRCCRLL
jgi:hypothetical protein